MTNTRIRTRRLLRALVLASSVLAGPAWAQSLPSGGQVVSGSATISQNGNALTIDQASDKLIANWQSFSIDTGSSVTFNQPTVNAVALNRVIGQDPSKILGSLNANGKVFLVNPNGIVVGKEGQVRTGGFVASTLGIKDADFLAGNYRFTGSGGSVLNQGSLKGAVVALIAPSVRNSGTITGDTAMAAGSDVLLDFDGDGLLSVEVKASTMATLVENDGLIAAKGGLAVLTAKGASDAMKGVVNNSGTIEAQSIGSRGGRIYLLGDMANGSVEVSGKLDASAPGGGDGGFIETSAAKVRIADSATITTVAPLGKTGTLLIDPHDYRIAGTGDNEDITGTGLTALLVSNNVTIQNSAGAASGGGDITLADDVNLYANTLTLTAARDILIKAELNILGTSTLVMNTATANGGEAGVAGGTVKVNIANDLSGFTGRVSFDRAGAGLLTINGEGYTVIDNIADLQAIATDASARYVLGTDIDASATAGWNGGLGWAPIANYYGVFDGLGHSVDALTALRPTQGYVGLFGDLFGTARNLNITNANIRGSTGGVLVGSMEGIVHNILVSGQVVAGGDAGGLASYVSSPAETATPSIYDVHSTVTVTALGTHAGGLIGVLNQAGLRNVSASGAVTGTFHVGGLIGIAATGTSVPSIEDAHATGAVSGQWIAGGLIGSLTGYRLANVSASGAVTNRPYTGSETAITSFGGLIGKATKTEIAGAVASGSVTIVGTRDIDGVGGLIGTANRLSLSNATATGAVSVTTPSGLAVTHVGGLVGFADKAAVSDPASTFTDVHAEGDVAVSSGADASYVGGLIGQAKASPITQASAAGDVTVTSLGNTEYLGGLVGELTGGSIANAQASGAVSGSSASSGTVNTRFFGGLLGSGTDTSLTDVSASGNVTLAADTVNATDGDAGGLLGTGLTVQITRASASGDVTANASRLGGLVGSLYSDQDAVLVSNVSASGSVTSTATLPTNAQNVGGLIGMAASGSSYGALKLVTVENATATGALVSGGFHVGGLIGWFEGVAVRSASASADVVAAHYGGGLIGRIGTGSLSDSWASGDVSGGSLGGLGGLVGASLAGSSSIERAFATGNVTGSGSEVGGLIGRSEVDLIDVFATGAVQGAGSVGGLAGYFEGSIYRAYASGAVSGTDAATTGGLIGKDLSYQLVASFYDRTTTGQSDSGKGTGLTSAQMADPFTFIDAGWDFASIWGTPKAGGAPLLRGFAGLPLYDHYVRIAGSLSRSYGDANPALSGLTLSGVGTGDLLIGWGSAAGATANAGTYGWFSPNLLSFGYATGNATDYYVAYGSGGLTITPRVISLTGARSYDRTTSVDASLFTLGNLANGETLVLTGAGQLADKSAGLGRSVAIGTLALGNGTGLASNYTLAGGTRTADIAQALITLSGVTAANKIYDGGLTATLDTSAVSMAGVIAGDSVGFGSATGAFLDKNVGTGKTVVISGGVLTGADAANYRFAPQSGATADITPATISAITGIGGGAKIYDTRTDTDLDYSGATFVGMIAGDQLEVASGVGAFDDKNAGTNKLVHVTGLSLGGTDAGNYTLADTTATAFGEISKSPLTSVAIAVATRAYDGTTAASVDLSSATFDQMYAGDDLTLASGSGAYADANAGIGKIVNVTGMTLGGADAGNYFLVSPDTSVVGTITQALLTLTGFTAANKVYDGNAAATITSAGTLSGVIGGDSVGFTYGNANFADKNAGTARTVTLGGITLTGTGADNYTIAGTATASADIDRKAITAINGLRADTRTYDGTTDASLDLGSADLVGVLGGDLVGLAAYSASFADKNAGSGKTVFVTGLGLGGADADNYVLASTSASAIGEITRAVLTLSGVSVADKVYDGTTDALVTNWGTLTGVVGTEDVSVGGGTVAFSDKNAGDNKAVSFAGLSLTGGEAGNYELASTATTTASISRATISAITGIAGVDKTYDGTTAAGFDASHAGFTGMIAGDALSVGSGSGFFTDKNAGAGKTVYIFGLALAGADADNYWLTSTNAVASADIARAVISGVTGITAASKTYDGTTNAVLDTSGASFAGRFGSDMLSVASATGSFADKNAGTGKAVDITGITLGGADAANYILGSTSASASADIGRATISAVTGITAAGKTYDGTTGVTLDTAGAIFAGKIGGDSLTVASASGSFADKNAGAGKLVGISGIALGGTDAGNYILASTSAVASADIARATIGAITGISAAAKTYDGSTVATLDTTGAAFAGMVAGDSLTVAAATGTFAEKNAGIGKVVDITGLALGGTDAGNYTLASTGATASADIARATIGAVTGITAASKTYDGTTSAQIDVSGATLAGMVAGDRLTISGTGSFADKNAGSGKTVDVTGLTLGGADAGNYVLAATSASASADIFRATISAVGGITAAGKTYDGTATATLDTTGATFDGMITGDVLSVASAAGSFADKNAGSGKAVGITGIMLGGADAGNYVLASTSATASADIGKATISAVTGITAAGKTYDGTTGAALNGAGAVFVGAVAGDMLTVAGATGSFADKSAGMGKAVTITGISLGGSDAGNYVLADAGATAIADIGRATITALGGIVAADKVYDGTTAATLDLSGTTFVGAVAGDVLTLSGSGGFADKNAGSDKAVTVTGLSLGGADAGNYDLAPLSITANADIARATISGVSDITARDKTYDGTTSAQLDTANAVLAGMIAGDSLTISGSGAFADKDGGIGKTVNITGLSLGGSDAGNYVLASTSTVSRADIARATITGASGIVARDRVYDGTTSAQIDTTGAVLAGMIAGDSLTISGTGSFADKNAGTNKTVAITGLALGGADADNYVLAVAGAAASATIERAQVSVSGITVDNKVYDGTVGATLDLSGAVLTGSIAGDSLTFDGAVGSFADKNAGDGKLVGISGIRLGGADAGNYVLSSGNAVATADIARATIGPVTGIVANDKVYDGTTAATLDLSGAHFDGGIAGDSVAIAASGSFTDKNAGAGKTVAIGLALTGADASNYVLGSVTAAASATISPATIGAVTGVIAAGRTYDGTTVATLDVSAAQFAGMIAGDQLVVASASGAFADKNAGSNKLVSITGIRLGGADADNYVLAATSATARADIARAAVTVSGIVAAGKTYDGTTAAVLDTSGAQFSGLIAGDTLRIAAATGSFADKNAGQGKNVTIGGVALGGADAGNYVLAGSPTATANIDQAVIGSITGILGVDRAYDGTASAQLDTSRAVFDGMVPGDHLGVAAAIGVFGDALPGRDKPIAVSGLVLGGPDAGNYRLASSVAAASASIVWEIVAPLFPDQLAKSRLEGFGGSTATLLSDPELIEDLTHFAAGSRPNG